MPTRYLFRAMLTAVCWGTWPSLMRFSTAPPIVKAFMFSGVTFVTVLVPFLASERGVYAGASRGALLIAAGCGLMNGLGTLWYQDMLSEVSLNLVSVLVTSILIGMILVAVAAGVLIHHEPVTPPRLVFFGLAILTLAAAGYAGAQDARTAKKAPVAIAEIVKVP
jgi:drug/metabolite transporter (DMT)-like permease